MVCLYDVIPSGKQNNICGTQNNIKFHIILNYDIPKIPKIQWCGTLNCTLR